MQNKNKNKTNKSFVPKHEACSTQMNLTHDNELLSFTSNAGVLFFPFCFFVHITQ